MKKRAPGATESAGASYNVETQSFLAEDSGASPGHPRSDQGQSGQPDQPGRGGDEVPVASSAAQEREGLGQRLLQDCRVDLRGRRRRSPALPTSHSLRVQTNDLVYWNNASSSPIEDVRLAKRTVQESTGFRPNILVLGRPVYDTLIDHADIIGRLDRGQTAGPAMATRESLAALFRA